MAWNTFVNGTVANAGSVNDNFSSSINYYKTYNQNYQMSTISGTNYYSMGSFALNYTGSLLFVKTIHSGNIVYTGANNPYFKITLSGTSVGTHDLITLSLPASGATFYAGSSLLNVNAFSIGSPFIIYNLKCSADGQNTVVSGANQFMGCGMREYT